MGESVRHDVLIIGSGIAGLRAAVRLGDGVDAAVVSKVLPTRSHSGAAQGGICAALGNEEEDRWEWHMYDTVKGSDFLGDQDVIAIMTRDAPADIIELEHMGVPFSRNKDGKIAQRPFGGHTRDFGQAPVKRACFASDRTGRVILDTLYEQCVKANVRFYAEYNLMDLLFREGRCVGAVLMDFSTGRLLRVQTKAVLLATGGWGKMFKTTSNCFANTGDGPALVFQKGFPLQDMEFIQFHPTGIKGFGILISEAVRGEGGILRNNLGERFMERYAPAIKDLAPRDIVARAIVKEVREGRGIAGEDYVHLDLTHLERETIEEKLWEIASFARIYAGIDAAREPIPVQPTCHYMMGGIPTDAWGQVVADGEGTPVPGLFAAGECACVSVHGANRLGTNSLLDLVVFGRRSGDGISGWLEEAGAFIRLPGDDVEERLAGLLAASGREHVPEIRRVLQETMTEKCSVFRDRESLKSLEEDLQGLRERYKRIGLRTGTRHFNYELMDAWELGHLLSLAAVTAAGALWREESRGAHFREDFPSRDDKHFLLHSLVKKRGAKGDIVIGTRPVAVTRFKPVERKY
jgi:succinate dehydrogenase / fumarate reductase flavoprotein subunit